MLVCSSPFFFFSVFGLSRLPIDSLSVRFVVLLLSRDQIQKLAAGSQRSNFMTVPTDCDQRDERLGWMGDADLSSDSMCLVSE